MSDPHEPQVTLFDTPYPRSRLYFPQSDNACPGLLTLHGSEGAGERQKAAALRLAQRGYTVLSYAYFAHPACLERIDIDLVESALEWLRALSLVVPHRVALWGVSRGAELALLLASRIRSAQRLAAVAVHAPSPVIWGGYDPVMRRSLIVPAWISADFPEGFRDGTRIPIESYEGRLFVAHGTADKVWPSQFSQEIEAARRKAGRHIEMHLFEEEGHIFSEAGQMREAELSAEFFATSLRQSHRGR